MASMQLKHLEDEKALLLDAIRKEYEDDQELKTFIVSNFQSSVNGILSRDVESGNKNGSSKIEDIKMISDYLKVLLKTSSGISSKLHKKNDSKRKRPKETSVMALWKKKKGVQWGSLDMNDILKNDTVGIYNNEKANTSSSLFNEKDRKIFGTKPFEDVNVVRCKRCLKVITLGAFLKHNDYCRNLDPQKQWSHHVSNKTKPATNLKSSPESIYSSDINNKIKLKKRKSPPENIEKPNNNVKRQIVSPAGPDPSPPKNQKPTNVITIERILKSLENRDEITPQHYRQVCHIIWSSRSFGRHLASHQYGYQFRLMARSLAYQKMSLLYPQPGTNTVNLKRYSSTPRKIHHDVIHASQPHIYAISPVDYLNQTQAILRNRMAQQQGVVDVKQQENMRPM